MTTSIVSPLEVCKRVGKQKGMIKEMIIYGLKKKMGYKNFGDWCSTCTEGEKRQLNYMEQR